MITISDLVEARLSDFDYMEDIISMYGGLSGADAWAEEKAIRRYLTDAETVLTFNEIIYYEVVRHYLNERGRRND